MKNPHTIAIMQPTFLPWLGYFGLIDAVDMFVILDDVQFDRRSWQQRNRIVSAGKELIITVPVKKTGKVDQLINNTEITEDWDAHRRKLLMTLHHSYSKAPFYKEFINDLEAILDVQEYNISKLNLNLINWACEKFNITTSILLASDVPVEGAKANYIVKICKYLSAHTYVSPPGSKVYIEQTDAFKKNNINLEYFLFNHPVYSQNSETFISHMSFVDALFNEGDKKTSALIKNSYSTKP